MSAPTTSAERDETQGLREREAGDGGHQLRAVDQGEALLGLERDRTQAHGGERLATGQPAAFVDALALADQSQREVGQGGEIAAGPDGSLRGHERMDTPVQQRDQQLERLETHAGEAAGEHVRAQQHERPRLRHAERCADAGRVRAQQVRLQLAQAIERNPDVGEVAEAGGHAVDDRAASDGVVDHASCGHDGLARGGGERDGAERPLRRPRERAGRHPSRRS